MSCTFYKASYFIRFVIIILPFSIYGQKEQSPGLRATHCMIYDEKNQKVILLDGTYPEIQPASGLSQLWAWDGKNWQQIHDTGPPARYVNSAVYDSKRQKIISYGGRAGKSEIISNNTWEWDGVQWLQMADTSIGRRDHQMMTYDVKRGKTVVFGGGKFPRTTPWARDTWEWDGKKWELKDTAGPLGRVAAMAYHKKSKKVILFGGVGEPPSPGEAQPLYQDTWAWNGKKWKQLSEEGPIERSRFAMCYEDKSNSIIIYGGEDNNNQQLGDMWKWDGKKWAEIKINGASPGKRSLHAMVYDIVRERIVLYGGNCEGKVVNDTWEWDGKQWQEIK